jgi:hypothetical protein
LCGEIGIREDEPTPIQLDIDLVRLLQCKNAIVRRGRVKDTVCRPNIGALEKAERLSLPNNRDTLERSKVPTPRDDRSLLGILNRSQKGPLEVLRLQLELAIVLENEDKRKATFLRRLNDGLMGSETSFPSGLWDVNRVHEMNLKPWIACLHPRDRGKTIRTMR